jgi:hypothetical protein
MSKSRAISSKTAWLWYGDAFETFRYELNRRKAAENNLRTIIAIVAVVLGATAHAGQSAKELYDVLGCNGCDGVGMFAMAIKEADTGEIVNVRGQPNTTVSDTNTAGWLMLQAVAQSSGKGRPIADGVFIPVREASVDSEGHYWMQVMRVPNSKVKVVKP